MSLPGDLIKQVKRVAVERDTSISTLLTAARNHALAAMTSARSLGTRGRPTWTRDWTEDMHEGEVIRGVTIQNPFSTR